MLLILAQLGLLISAQFTIEEMLFKQVNILALDS